MNSNKITIPNITEHRAVKLFDQKFGCDVMTRFEKIAEEFNEFEEALAESIAHGSSEHMIDELSDLYATVTHFAHLMGLYQKDLLEMAIDKVTKRETDPDYKRYK
jgi:NTP pyrophosphatase (non-canonical NTP hydrolase)